MKKLILLLAAFAMVAAMAVPAGFADMKSQGSSGQTQGIQKSEGVNDYVFGLRWSDGSCMTKTVTASSHDEALNSVKRLCTNCSISDIGSSGHPGKSPELFAKVENFCPAGR